MQIKSTLRLHLTLVRRAVIKKANTCWARSRHLGVEDGVGWGGVGTLLVATLISADTVGNSRRRLKN